MERAQRIFQKAVDAIKSSRGFSAQTPPVESLTHSTGTTRSHQEYPYVEPENPNPPIYKPTEDNRIAHIYRESGQTLQLHNIVDPHPMLGGDKLSRVTIETSSGEVYYLRHYAHELETRISKRWPLERRQPEPSYTFSEFETPDAFQKLASTTVRIGKPFEFIDPLSGEIITTGEVVSCTAVSERQYTTTYLQTYV